MLYIMIVVAIIDHVHLSKLAKMYRLNFIIWKLHNHFPKSLSRLPILTSSVVFCHILEDFCENHKTKTLLNVMWDSRLAPRTEKRAFMEKTGKIQIKSGVELIVVYQCHFLLVSNARW